MADPEIDHGFVEDSQGRTDILRSPFFDIRLGYDQSAEDYVGRILYRLSLSIEEQIRPGRWQIIGHPSTSPPPAISLANKALRITCLTVASLGLLITLLR
ncbi:hypothetical protein M5K25_017230 [Dendrobium thyrsiflorum]|uniref:Uncharacterized protein n=1 Tax=Dendrobium thyrsiflorum TaxID=117978 RepID=A0ABD0UTK9_DENTH